jgi:hypothetical protein
MVRGDAPQPALEEVRPRPRVRGRRDRRRRRRHRVLLHERPENAHGLRHGDEGERARVEVALEQEFEDAGGGRQVGWRRGDDVEGLAGADTVRIGESCAA